METDTMNEGKALLGLLICDFDKCWATAVAGGIRADWFGSSDERTLFGIIKRMADGGECVDPLLVADEAKRSGKLTDATKAVDECVQTYISPAYLNFHLDNLRSRWVGRNCAKAAQSAQSEFMDCKDPVAAALKLRDRLGEIAAGGVVDEIDNAAVIDAKVAEWRALSDEKSGQAAAPRVGYPWYCLSSLVKLRPGLHVVAARVSEGKTLFAQNCSMFWAGLGIPHAFVSIDMPASELLARYVSSGSRVSLRYLDCGAPASTVDAAGREAEKVKRFPVKITEESNVDKVCAWLRVQKARFGIEAAIVDYVQLLKGAERLKKHEMLGDCVLALKRLSVELKIPVMLLAQLSREAEKATRENAIAEPLLSDLSDTSELEKAASSVLLIYRDGKVAKSWRETPPERFTPWARNDAAYLRPMWVKVAKNQQGMAGVRLPFVAFPKEFMVRPADYEAASREDAFLKLRDDWRHLPEDEAIGAMGGFGSREPSEWR